MAKHKGRGISAIEYPTGMNQNGDPSQAWIKMKPDGRVDVFSGTSDIGNGSKTIQSQIVADTLGVPYDWVTYDNSNTDSSPVCTGTFASRATFVAGMAVKKAADSARTKLLEIAGKELEIDPSDLEVVDGEVIAKGAPQKKISVPDVAVAATWTHGELITGTGAHLNPYAPIVDAETGRVELPPHAAISYAACAAEVEVDDETGDVRVTRLVQCYDVGKAINPTLVEGQIEGGAVQGLGLGVLENCYPYYPSVENRGGQFGSYLAPGMEDLPQVDTLIIENPSAGGPYGAKGIGEMANNPQPPAIAAAVYDAVGVWVTELPITPGARAACTRREGRADPQGQDGDLRRGALGECGLGRRDALRGACLSSPFRSWNDVEPHTLFPGVGLRAIGGEQVLLCHVTYEPGTTVQRHSHETAEQVMWIVDGAVTMTIGEETKELVADDVVVVNPGIEHELHSPGGVTFVEALAPVLRDHVPDAERDLVLGAHGDSLHAPG